MDNLPLTILIITAVFLLPTASLSYFLFHRAKNYFIKSGNIFSSLFYWLCGMAGLASVFPVLAYLYTLGSTYLDLRGKTPAFDEFQGIGMVLVLLVQGPALFTVLISLFVFIAGAIKIFMLRKSRTDLPPPQKGRDLLWLIIFSLIPFILAVLYVSNRVFLEIPYEKSLRGEGGPSAWWPKYENEIYGFSLKYPLSYYDVRENVEGAVVVFGIKVEGGIKSGVKAYINQNQFGSFDIFKKDLQQKISEEAKEFPDNKFSFREENIGGVSAILVKKTFEGPYLGNFYNMYMDLGGGTVLSFTGDDNNQTLEYIYHTFQLVTIDPLRPTHTIHIQYWKNYKNEQFGLELKYPESQGWQVISEGPEVIFKASAESQNIGDYWFSIKINANKSSIRNTEDWVNDFYRGIESYNSYQKEKMGINGLPAFRLRYEGTEQSPANTITYILRHDKVYEFTCLTTYYLDQSDGICDAMLRSVRFSEK